MVLICSSVEDISTCYVMDWIEKFGHEVVRINEDCQIINITSSFYESENNFTFVLNDGRRISSQNVSSFWFRRGGLRFSQSHFPTMNQSIGINVTNHLKDEVKTLISYILFYLQNKTKIGDYSQRNANKLISLQIAQECGLRIPKTCISSQKTDLMDFSSECTSSITKSIQDILFFHVNDERFSTKTSKVTMADINTMDDIFFPSLLQEEIKKKYELRIFYLKGAFYSMAIFSQQDKQTEIDYRNYNEVKPNRMVPYSLPQGIEQKLTLFMHKMLLDTGSIDMIVTSDFKYVFLEVNPVGQYNMVSHPCNYYLHPLLYPSNLLYECPVRCDNSWVICPDGSLYKCREIAGNEDFKVGYINNDGTITITNESLLLQYLEGADPLSDNNCIKCKTYPICGGGCVHARIMKKYYNAKVNTCAYSKDFIEKFISVYYESQRPV